MVRRAAEMNGALHNHINTKCRAKRRRRYHPVVSILFAPHQILLTPEPRLSRGHAELEVLRCLHIITYGHFRSKEAQRETSSDE